jgi:hypothetical protein
MLRAALVAWLMAAVITGTAISGSLEDAIASYEHGAYATAMGLFRPLAEDAARRPSGTAGPANKGSPLPSSLSVLCTCEAMACHRIMPWH